MYLLSLKTKLVLQTMYSNHLHFSRTNERIKQKLKAGCFFSLSVLVLVKLSEFDIKKIPYNLFKCLITP